MLYEVITFQRRLSDLLAQLVRRCVDLRKAVFINEQLDALSGADPEMIVAFWADLEVLVYFLFSYNFV